jgi:hypothetical protein
MSRRARRAAALVSLWLGIAVDGRDPLRAAPPPAAAAPARIVHDPVQCVIAGRHPRLQTCFAPTEAIARAQVQFRGDETGPWYSVDMTADGACRSALLPKPVRGLAAVHYFIEAVDRVAGIVRAPANAPADAFAARVVEAEADCGAGQRTAASVPRAAVVVGIARDAEGKPVPAEAVRAAEDKAFLSGFSADGVTMASTGVRPRRAAGTAAAEGRTAAGGLSGTETAIVVGAGVAAAGVIAAILAAGNKAKAAVDPATTDPLTGHWVGTVDSGAGLTLFVTVGETACTYRWDLTSDLVQSGASLSGSATAVSRSASCSFQAVPTLPPPFSGPASAVPINGAASGGALTFEAGISPFRGTYTASLLDASGSLPGLASGGTATYTWRQTKQ